MNGKKLRDQISANTIAIVPGAGSPLELHLIERAGFEAAYISGYATAANRFGLPDIGLMGYREMGEMVHAATAVSSLPLIVDCDTGYGDVANVRRVVRNFEAVGVAAVQIEDQCWPKRCGHMDGKVVESAEIAVRKVRAAVEARRGDDMLIVARTDSAQPFGLDEALERCKQFKREGADVLFVDGPETEDDLARIAGELPGPVMVNMSESGKTPILPADRLEQLGFAIAIYPSSSVRVAVDVLGAFYRDLRRERISTAWTGRMATLEETNNVLGIEDIKAFEQAILSKSRIAN